MSNNLGRTEVSISQTQKELAINNSDGILDAAITSELTIAWSGSDALKVLTTTQLRRNNTFVMSGTTSAPAPVLKMAAVQRGMVLVRNDLGVDLRVTDDSTADEVVVRPGVLAAIYVTATGVKRIFESDSIVLPADTSTSVRVATTANITISTDLNNGDTIDGVVLATNDRVLVKNQTSGAENGIYIVGASPSRATDFDDGGTEVYAGVLITVEEGDTNSNSLWILTTNNPITVGTTSLTFKKLSQNTIEIASNAQVLQGVDLTRAVPPGRLASLWTKGSNIASASTITIGDGRYFHVTGTTDITDIDWAVPTNGREAVLTFDNVLTLIHSATLDLPGGADIVTAAGDRAAFIQDAGDTVYCVWYQRADGTAIVSSGGLTASTTTEVLQGSDTTVYVTPDALAALWEKGSNVASASTVSFDEGGFFHITGTATINDIDWTTPKNGRWAVVTFDDSLTITYNATTLRLPGAADITTAAGDTAMFVQDNADNVICVWYQRADGTAVVDSPAYPTFVSLTDTPSSYSSHSLKAVRVNAGETGLEFYTPASGYTDEQAQDAVAAMIQNGTGITWSYDDNANTLTPTVSGTSAIISDFTEAVQDVVGAFSVGGTGITVTYDDNANTLTFASTITQYTDEMAQDAVAAMIQNGTGITWSYDDNANTLTPTVSGTSAIISDFAEAVQDVVGAFSVGGTGITVTYDDNANTLTFASTITQYTDEQAQDAVASALANGRHVGVTPVYDDPNNLISLVSNHRFLKQPNVPKRNFVNGIPWISRAESASNAWYAVEWSPELGLFAAAAITGTGNRVMTSPDGINWTTRTTPADNEWRSIAWSPELGLFAAVSNTGTGNRVMTSPDGITWTSRTPATDNNWLSVVWAREINLFVAVAISGSGNRVMTSPDGINWTSRTSAANNNWRSVAWSPSLRLLVAVANSGTGNRVMTSPDGITWTSRTSAADNNWQSVCWSPELGLFVAVANSGTGDRVMTSPDGITWTLRTSAADNNWQSVCWSPELGLFVAVANSGTGNRIMTSPDGITWTLRTSAADNSWAGVVWSPQLEIFCAVGQTGTNNRVMTSMSGLYYGRDVEVIAVAASDETTALTVGTEKVTFRIPVNFRITEIYASLSTAQTSGSLLTVDVNANGNTIMTTNKLVFNNTHKTTRTASSPPVLTTQRIIAGDEMTVDIDVVGDGTAKGLKVYLVGFGWK